jgi:hypothetical protein
MKDMGVDS